MEPNVSESPPRAQAVSEEPVGQSPRTQSEKRQFTGSLDETIDRLIIRADAELGVTEARPEWRLFAILRAAYRAKTSDPRR
jgi:hypothetical protein